MSRRRSSKSKHCPDFDTNSIIDGLLDLKKNLFKESSKMEGCMTKLRSFLTTDQTAKFILLMEKVNNNSDAWYLTMRYSINQDRN